jgi:hypothetical protein
LLAHTSHAVFLTLPGVTLIGDGLLHATFQEQDKILMQCGGAGREIYLVEIFRPDIVDHQACFLLEFSAGRT